eukprot:TRINITY_DN55402_c0_g1_i1.p1 TRINITY_DN55402_c0_g1~~TRINITY_DN55402_c0_g1_i1.p1  ORF type:complete len:1033 (-),score=161.97 TRINITY_DN55402_c0_g1_i1:265-3363(-)
MLSCEKSWRGRGHLAAILHVFAAGRAAAAAAANTSFSKLEKPQELGFDRQMYWRDVDPLPSNGASVPRARGAKKAFRTRSKFQLLEVLVSEARNDTFLFLDRVLQLSTLGEHMYHEMMAHVPLLTLSRTPRNVLIIGAGDGGVTLRVLRHPGIQKVVQVELDGAVVSISRRFFPQLAEAFDDPRVELRIQDAIEWAIQTAAVGERNVFDACIIDSTDDPLGSPWTFEFFSALRQLLRPGGVLMQNVQGFEMSHQMVKILELHKRGGFEVVRPVLITTVDYESPYVAFLSSGAEYGCPGLARADNELLAKLRCSWYSPAGHRAAFAVPPALERRIPAFAVDPNGCLKLFTATSGGANRHLPDMLPQNDDALRDAGEKTRLVTDFDFVIVGGGLSGITVAHVLALHARPVCAGSNCRTPAKILLLEAQHRFGGRIETTDPATFAGIPANVGANWIHYAEGNPMLELAQRAGCPTEPSRNSNLRWSAAQLGTLTRDAVEAARMFAERLVFDKDLHQRNLRAPSGSQLGASVASFLANVTRHEQSMFVPASDAAEEAARHLHFFSDLVQDHTARVGEMSLSHYCEEATGGDSQSSDVIFAGRRGTACVLDWLLEQLPPGSVELRAGHVLREVRETFDISSPSVELLVEPQGATTTASAKASPSAHPAPYRVRAGAVILTVPLGVLQASVAAEQTAAAGFHRKAADRAHASPDAQSDGQCAAGVENIVNDTCVDSQSKGGQGLVRFIPPIPVAVAQTWRRLGFGRSLRVAFAFDEAFWDTDVEFFGHLLPPDIVPDSTFASETFFTYGDQPAVEFTNALNSTRRPVLLAEVNRVLADYLETLSDENISSFFVTQVLKEVFPHVKPSDLLPVSVAVKRFHADPFTRGALSYNSVSGERAGSETLANEAVRWAPIWTGRLHFAGEHTAARHKGTLDAAVFSGIQAAWAAACFVFGESTARAPASILRSLAIFKGWFGDASAQECLERESAMAMSRATEVQAVCKRSWLFDIEAKCRRRNQMDATPVKKAPSRHCLDQGN